MKRVTGVLTKKLENDFHGTKLYSFQIDDVPRYYRTGKEPIPYEVGNIISFDDRNGTVSVDSITDGKAEAKDPEVYSPPTKSPDVRPAEPSVSDRIRYQQARADAVSLVGVALAHDHLPHPANTGKHKRLGLLLQYVEQVTETFLNQEDRYGTKEK